MNTMNREQVVWNGFAASIPGAGHIRYGIPCQDASSVILSPRPALIVCDGRGSASYSHFGANAAVKAFKNQIAIFEPMLASILDKENDDQDRWRTFSRIIYRTLMQVKLDLAEEYKNEFDEKEFDFTVACAIVGTSHIGCFQVGDGAIVLRQNGECLTAFLPDKGKFANETKFLRKNRETIGDFKAKLFDAAVNSGITITSDGPEHLMFQLPEMIPGPIFEKMLVSLQQNDLCHQDIMDYLTRSVWNNDPRGIDDRSLAILAPVEYCLDHEPADIPTAPSEPVCTENKATASGESEVTPETSFEPALETQPDQMEKCKRSSSNKMLIIYAAVFFIAGAILSYPIHILIKQKFCCSTPQTQKQTSAPVLQTEEFEVKSGTESGKEKEPGPNAYEHEEPTQKKQNMIEKKLDPADKKQGAAGPLEKSNPEK